MHVVAFCRRHELAHLFQPFGCEPALSPSPLNRKAISRLFIGPAELMAALMCMNPQPMRTNTLVLIGRVLFIHRATVVEGPSMSIDLTSGGYDRQRMKNQPSPSMPYDRQDLPGAPFKRFSARP
jgi:hypothetical protein